MQRKIRTVLKDKGHNVYSISPIDTVFKAIDLMAEKGIGSLVVLEDGKIVGLITERNYTREVILKGRSSVRTFVKDIMDAPVVCASPDHRLNECMALMMEKGVKHLPIVEDNRLVGLVSIGDLVRAVVKDQEFVISQLEHYIHG